VAGVSARRILITGLSTHWGGRLAQTLERDAAVEAIVGVDTDDPRQCLDLRQARRCTQPRGDSVRRPERAIATFETILKRPAGASHSLILAALFGIADAHLQLKTPETGEDVLEDFIDHHPRDVDLALIFAKLDELYRAKKKPSRTHLESWVHDSSQPRRAFAQWYFARL